MKPNLWFGLMGLVLLPVEIVFACQSESRPDQSRFLDQLNSLDIKVRVEGAEELAKTVAPLEIVPALLAQLEKEQSESVQLAIHFVLACQGEKEHTRPLVDSLYQEGRLGYRYLRLATGNDFGANPGRYERWYRKTSERQFRDFIIERWRRKPMMDEFVEFKSLFWKQYMEGWQRVSEGGFPESEQSMSEREKQRLAEMPTAKSWMIFKDALVELDEHGDRKAAADLFRRIVDEYPNTYYADQARELSQQLDGMLVEDAEFEMPQDFKLLSLDDQIAIHIYFLRDTRAFQFGQPGDCRLSFSGTVIPGAKEYNPALALYELGQPAAEVLAEYFDDRRPIRGVGYWRDFVPVRKVLRYGDAAEQIYRKIN